MAAAKRTPSGVSATGIRARGSRSAGLDLLPTDLRDAANRGRASGEPCGRPRPSSPTRSQMREPSVPGPSGCAFRSSRAAGLSRSFSRGRARRRPRPLPSERARLPAHASLAVAVALRALATGPACQAPGRRLRGSRAASWLRYASGAAVVPAQSVAGLAGGGTARSASAVAAAGAVDALSDRQERPSSSTSTCTSSAASLGRTAHSASRLARNRARRSCAVPAIWRSTTGSRELAYAISEPRLAYAHAARMRCSPSCGRAAAWCLAQRGDRGRRSARPTATATCSHA